MSKKRRENEGREECTFRPEINQESVKMPTNDPITTGLKVEERLLF